jgi:hypothetical protein
MVLIAGQRETKVIEAKAGALAIHEEMTQRSDGRSLPTLFVPTKTVFSSDRQTRVDSSGLKLAISIKVMRMVCPRRD